MSPYGLEVVALLVIAGATVLGFKLMESLIAVTQINHDILHNREIVGALGARLGRGPFATQYGDYFESDEQLQVAMSSAKAIVVKREGKSGNGSNAASCSIAGATGFCYLAFSRS